MCFANLLSAVMVKSISIVHNAYAVAANTSQSNIAFCMLYIFGFRLTWAVLPWSILVLSWLSVLPRLRRLEVSSTVLSPDQQIASIDLAVSVMDERSVVESEPPAQEKEGNLHLGQLSIADKITLGSIWLISLLYGLLTEQFLSKEIDLPCSVSNKITTYQGISSVTLAILLPTACGPALAGLTHLVISLLNTVRGAGGGAADSKEENRKMEIRNLLCILALILVFLPTYISSMIITELYLDINNIFSFVVVKYIVGNTMTGTGTSRNNYLVGTCQHTLVPLAILITKNEIYQSAKEVNWRAVESFFNPPLQVYRSGGTIQGKDLEITAEQIQKELGLGVRA